MNKISENQIIHLMKEDIQKQFKNISEEELVHFSNNLFVLCSLKANNIDNQTIINKIMSMNNYFIANMEQNGVNINSDNCNLEEKFYTSLKNKYVRMIKRQNVAN